MNILARKPDGKRPLRKPRSRCDDIIKMSLKEISERERTGFN
jgi:hypothetical protein